MAKDAYKLHDYMICSALDGRERIMGMTKDEFFPLLGIALIGVLSMHIMAGVIVGLVAFSAIKTLKACFGDYATTLLLYRYATRSVAALLFPGAPNPTIRTWW